MKYLTKQEELILLAIFQLKDSAYLVTIRKHLIEYSGKKWSVGAVYVPLDRLKKLGYLDTRVGGSNAKRGRNTIKYYQLTELGIKTLIEIKKVHDVMWTGFSDVVYTT